MSISRIAYRARQLFLSCQCVDGKDVSRKARDLLTRYDLWISNIGVFAPGLASLDHRLRTARVPQIAVEGNLDILCSSLLSGKH